MTKHIERIHARALEAAGRYKAAEADLIEILQLADRERVYFHLGCKSLFDYVTQSLGLCEGAAYNLITVSRKAVEVPSLKEAIRLGSLTVSKARKISAVVTPSNQSDWIQKAINLPSRKLEEEVARAVHPEKSRDVGIHLSLPHEIYERLKRAQDLESQRRKKSVSFEETLKAVLAVYLERQDPVQKAERAIKGKPTNPIKLVTGRVTAAIPAASRHQAHLRDQGRCTYFDPNRGTRCAERRWIDLHHVIPRNQGGTHAARNLRTLCSAHHRLLHLKMEAGT